INFSVACICSLCQLIDVITNRSQLLCYLNRPRFINLGGLHAIPQCPLFRNSWHTHMKIDRKSTRLNSSHVSISYAVICLKKEVAAILEVVEGREEGTKARSEEVLAAKNVGGMEMKLRLAEGAMRVAVSGGNGAAHLLEAM